LTPAATPGGGVPLMSTRVTPAVCVAFQLPSPITVDRYCSRRISIG